MAQASLELDRGDARHHEAAQPITGRGVGYKLFTAGLIPSMSTNDMQKVYRLLRDAREQGDIPWEWIVDETRALERVSTWSNPQEYARCCRAVLSPRFLGSAAAPSRSLVREGHHRGVLKPVLDHYAVGFRVMHGFHQRNRGS